MKPVSPVLDPHGDGQTEWRTYEYPVVGRRPYRPQCSFVCIDLVDTKTVWMVGPHVHDGFELIHPQMGDYACRVNEKEIVVRAGQTLMIRPEDRHEDVTRSACKFVAVRFLLLGSHRYSGQFDLFRRTTAATDLIFEDTAPLLAEFQRRVVAELEIPGLLTASLLDSLMQTLFWDLLRKLPNPVLAEGLGPTPRSSFENRLIEVFETTREKISSVGDIAKQLGMSVSSLERACKRELNISAARALMRFRMAEALELVRHTPTPMKEISELLGFQNPNHFSSAFSKHFGRPPSAFRAEPVGATSDASKPNTRRDS